ncbi:MAG: serine/threonine protein kinase [Saprospiraceae bacterium]|nr:serine/threonine protein kinase [Saprospiraceae bacterium]
MKKYQLSRQYRFLTSEDVSQTNSKIADQLKQGEVFGLINRSSGDCIILNTPMYLFLKEYKTPKKIEEVAAILANTFNSTQQAVLPIVQQFFKEMKQQGIIISPKAVKHTEIIEPYTSGTLLDHYRIEKNLSSNLPIEVYKATNLLSQQNVILKVLRIPSLLGEKKQKKWRKTFKKEFSIQKILRGHPNICQLLELTPDYAVLEWIDGISLRKWVDEGGVFDTSLRQTFLSQILNSYSFMHAKGILHGDIHSSNIFISNNSTIKIIDFDLAHQLTKNNHLPELGGGVPEFIPPENIRFSAFDIVKGKANYRTEVYQLGIIAYWIVYGKLPFTGEIWQDMAADILHKDIDFANLCSNGDEVSPSLVAFLKKSLAKTPDNRFASAIEMSKSFRKISNKNDKILA